MSNLEIKNNFSRQALFYNDLALIQKNAANKLYNLTKNFILPNSKILDLGSGTSFISKNLDSCHAIFEIDFSLNMLEQWRERPKNVSAILADFKNLPFRNQQKFDIIFSSFALQWIEDLEALFFKLSTLLNKNGVIAFCLPTEKTLFEIKEANKKSNCNFSIKNFPCENYLKKLLKENGFEEKKIYSEVIKEPYKMAIDCLRNIKKTGANFSDKNLRTPNCITRKKIEKFNDFFLKDSDNKVSWYISYFIFHIKNV